MPRFGLVVLKGSPLAKWLKKNKLRLTGTIKTSPKPALELSQPVAVLPHLLQHPSTNFSERLSKVDLVVIHDTEGPYSIAVTWLSNPKAQASAHVVLREDGKEATQLVRWTKKAWACMAFNGRSLNLEMAGKASVGYSPEQIDAAARIAAYWCKLYGIPARHAVGGMGHGITFHQELGAAGGGHSDPGWNEYQKSAFIAKVDHYLKGTFTPARWGKA